jgi:hypothetical protein
LCLSVCVCKFCTPADIYFMHTHKCAVLVVGLLPISVFALIIPVSCRIGSSALGNTDVDPLMWETSWYSICHQTLIFSFCPKYRKHRSSHCGISFRQIKGLVLHKTGINRTKTKIRRPSKQVHMWIYIGHHQRFVIHPKLHRLIAPPTIMSINSLFICFLYVSIRHV